MKNVSNRILVLLSSVMLSASVIAQQETTDGETLQATDPVFLFNEICYSQVPDVLKIQDMAKRFAWVPMGGDDLERFTSVKTPALLEGWDIRLDERIFRLGIVQSDPADSFITTFPDMSDSVSTSCTLVLDGQDDAQTLLDRLNLLVGKEPTTQDVPEGQLLTTTWSGGNDLVKVFVFYKTDAIDRANLMNVTIVTK